MGKPTIWFPNRSDTNRAVETGGGGGGGGGGGQPMACAIYAKAAAGNGNKL